MPSRKSKASRRVVVKEEPSPMETTDASSKQVKEEPMETGSNSSKRVKDEPPPKNTTDISSKRAKVSNPDMLRKTELIQRVWRTNFRLRSTKSYAVGFLKVIPLKHIKSISFPVMVVFLREKYVIAIAKQFLERLHRRCTYKYGSPPKALEPENVNVRVVLSAYMIAVQPAQVFDSMGVLEQSLYESAVVLTTDMEHLARDIVRRGAPCLFDSDKAKSFPIVIFEFLKRFKAWKVPDEARLACRIKHALVALYQAEQQFPPNEPENSKLKLEFRTQIERLRGKLQQIAGVDALTEFDKNYKSGTLPLTLPIGEGYGPGAYASLPGRMSNEHLAHELLMDPLFQLSDTGDGASENPFYHRIRQSFHKAFWESLVEDLKFAAPCYVRVLRVLREIRDGIIDLAGSKEAHAIEEAIDLDLIKQQTELCAFGWVCCKRLVASVLVIIMRIQSPSRDASTSERWRKVGLEMEQAEREDQDRIFCGALEFLLDLVNILRIDAANTRLRLLSPIIKTHGIDYERGKFQDKLRDGTLTLTNTKELVENAMRHELFTQNTTHADLAKGQAKSFNAVLITAMVMLIVNTDPIKIENIAETLHLDFSRASLLQRDFHAIVNGLTILATTTNALGNALGKQQVLTELSSYIVDSEGLDVSFVLEKLGKGLDSYGLLTDSAVRDKVFVVLKNCVNKDDAVRQLIASRVRKTLSDFLHKTPKVIDDKLMNVARPLIPLIEALSVKIAFLLDVNRAIHSSTYNSLIAAAVGGFAEAAAAAK